MSNRDEMMSLMEQLVYALGQMLGDQCEVVLHDLRHPADSTIVAIANGHVTGRKVGDPSTNLGLPVIKNPQGDYNLFNYRSQTKSGRILKSSSLHLKDSANMVYAALCINWDITDLVIAGNVLKDLTQAGDIVEETYATDINDVITSLIENALAVVRKPVDGMDKEDKLRIIQTLDEKGVFSVKKAVGRVAAALGISRVTVYSYLNELQAMKESKII